MGASYDYMFITARNQKEHTKMLTEHITDLGWSYGHEYSGTLNMKPGFIDCGTLPPYMTVAMLEELSYQVQEILERGSLLTRIGTANVQRALRKMNRPRWEDHRDAIEIITKWINTAHGDKWEKGGFVQLNKGENKKRKTNTIYDGTRATTRYYAGWCSS